MESQPEKQPPVQGQDNRQIHQDRRHITDHIAYFDSLVDAKPVEVPINKARCSNLDGVMLVTTVGSGVAICLHEPSVRAGGLAHVFLPPPVIDEFPLFSEQGRRAAHAYEHVMSGLVATLTQLGGKTGQMRAKIFGGGAMTPETADRGSKMVVFAKEFILRHGIKIITEDTGLPAARRIQFIATQGKGLRRILKRGSDLQELRQMEAEYKPSL